MEPTIQGTQFGSIAVGGRTYQHDIVIRLSGKVTKRKKKLSKREYGTSHTVSPDEARHIFDEGTKRLIVGTGQYSALKLSEEAEDYFSQKGCSVELLPTPDAVQAWNKAEGPMIAMFHVTC